jgi:hypothetical protein
VVAVVPHREGRGTVPGRCTEGPSHRVSFTSPSPASGLQQTAHLRNEDYGPHDSEPHGLRDVTVDGERRYTGPEEYSTR